MPDIPPREHLDRVLAGQSVDRPPVICTGGMMNAAVVGVMSENGLVLPAAHFDPKGMAKLSERVQAATEFENLGVPFCMTVEPGVLGSRTIPALWPASRKSPKKLSALARPWSSAIRESSCLRAASQPWCRPPII